MITDKIEILHKAVLDGFEVRQFGRNNNPHIRAELQNFSTGETIECSSKAVLELERDNMLILDCCAGGSEYALQPAFRKGD